LREAASNGYGWIYAYPEMTFVSLVHVFPLGSAQPVVTLSWIKEAYSMRGESMGIFFNPALRLILLFRPFFLMPFAYPLDSFFLRRI